MVVGRGETAFRSEEAEGLSILSTEAFLRGEEVRCSVCSGLERVEEDDEVEDDDDVVDKSWEVVGTCGELSSGATDT